MGTFTRMRLGALATAGLLMASGTASGVSGHAAAASTSAVMTASGSMSDSAERTGARGAGRAWVSAWTASMQGPSTLGLDGLGTISGTLQQRLLQVAVPPPRSFADETLRQVMYLHGGGDRVRIRLSNRFGTRRMTFPEVTLGIRQGRNGADVRPGSSRPLTFGGERSVSIARGAAVLSDPVRLHVDRFDHVVVDVVVPAGSGAATAHGNSMQTFFTAPGDHAGENSDEAFAERGLVLGGGRDLVTHLASTLTTASYFVEQIQVRSAPGSKTLVAFGDSITDGFLSTVGTDRRYPDALARRLAATAGTRCLSVVNQAVSGGRLTGPGIGPSGLSRFRREVLRQPNVAGVIVLQGINDLGTAILQDVPRTAADLIAAYRKLARIARAAGVPMWIGTLTPAGNLLRPSPYGLYSSPAAVADRHTVNAWLRGPGRRLFAGVIDFDRVVKDPLMPDWLSTLRYDAGDNLHPNDAGYAAMARSVPVRPLARLCR